MPRARARPSRYTGVPCSTISSDFMRPPSCSPRLWRPAWTARLGALTARRAKAGEVRMEGVEPSWPVGRRLLRPVREPISPHPHEEPQARDAERAARRLTRAAAGAVARDVRPRDVPCDVPRAARPWRDAAPAWAVPRLARDGDASPAPLYSKGAHGRPLPRERPERSRRST